MGPTAAGKTGLAMRIADRFRVRLISVDSGQVYRGMDIGTAKLSEREMSAYPHALIDIRDPAKPYSADEFRHDALEQMDLAVNENTMPLLVGGTMFYFRTLQYGLPDLPSANDEVRQRLIDDAAEHGWPALYKRLQDVDPLSAQRIDGNDRQRIQRALEIYELSGIPASQHKPHDQQDLAYDFIKLGIWPGDRSVLHARIEKRLEQMFAEGFVEEVKRLHARPDLHGKLPAMRAVGYRQVIDYLNGETDYATMRERCVFATRQLAKRQLTWLRNDPDVLWFDTEDVDFEEKVLEFLQKTTSVGRYIA
jgi:tRNA dimethylallyltransferase